MKKKAGKMMSWSLGGITFLLLVLVIHIYTVTRPRIDEHTRVMARIDIKQAVSQEQSDQITAWLYKQKGIDHVLINPKTSIAIFTFFPVKTNANLILKEFKEHFKIKAERFIPDKKQLASGCPIASTSYTYKIYSFIKNIF